MCHRWALFRRDPCYTDYSECVRAQALHTAGTGKILSHGKFVTPVVTHTLHSLHSRDVAGHERIEKHNATSHGTMQHACNMGPTTHGMHVALPLDACFTRG
jgi:hypothetical protein